jgi:heparosan-N-sulfate-glucuronate 5-epimerase
MINHIFTTIVRYLHPYSSVKFWHTTIAPVEYEYPLMEDYYIDFTAKIDYSGPYDSNGIPILDYFGLVGRQYNPCAVAQWGLGAWQSWRRENNSTAEKKFWDAAYWLKENITVINQNQGYWYYKFDFDSYSQKAPWASALAQAQGISVLLRAAKISADKAQWADFAKLALNGLITPVENGGLLGRIDGKEIFEEVVADRPTAILDGMLFAIMGLQDYCYFFPNDKSAASLLARMYKNIEILLPRYDLKYWSRADLYMELPPMPASFFYHRLHIAQLKVLGILTNNMIFLSTSEKWYRYEKNPFFRFKALIKKLIFKFTRY